MSHNWHNWHEISQHEWSRWESQSTSPPVDALRHCVDLWTYCGGSSDYNLVLLLCVLASNVQAISTSVFSFLGALNVLLYIP